MRDLEQAESITGDFLLVSGDVVSNISLEPALAKHRARREKDKNAIMTMILRETNVAHRTKSKASRPVFVIESATERCLHYEEIGWGKYGSNNITMDPEILASSDEVEVREDLVDCRIDICSQDVLLEWSDNFDYTSVRKSFLRGVLKDYETSQKTVHTYVVTDQYAARLRSLRTYDAISKDITERWTYPLCPDSNLESGQSYSYSRDQNYEENNVTVGRSTRVNKSVLGSGTVVGVGSTINGSTLGRRCHIGNNVTVDRAYLWDDVRIDDGVIIRHAIVASNTSIWQNCMIEPATLISYEVQIPEKTTVTKGSRVTKDQDSYRLEDSDTDGSDRSSVSSSDLDYLNSSASSSTFSISTLASVDVDSNSQDYSRRDSFRSDPSDDVGENSGFHNEAMANIFDGLQKGDSLDTIILELNSWRMSTNASQHEVRKALVAALMKSVASLVDEDSTQYKQDTSPREAVRILLPKYKPLAERTIFDQNVDLKVDQVDLLLLIQKELSGWPNGEQLMLFVAQEAYDREIVEENGLLQWWEDERSRKSDVLRVRKLTEPLIAWLQEAEEDEDEDDDSD